MFMNTAIDRQLAKFAQDNGREPTDDEAAKIRAWTLATVRGTVQADILKEDPGQNTCIFSTEFSLIGALAIVEEAGGYAAPFVPPRPTAKVACLAGAPGSLNRSPTSRGCPPDLL
jgi:methylmalonyl-CoA mutase N-terminal domain/subunit